MKPDAVLKINKIGKVGQILTLIGKIVLGMGLFFTLLGTIIMAAMPEDLITADVRGGISMVVDLSTMGFDEIPAEDKEMIQQQFSAGEEVNGTMITSTEVEGSKVIVEAEASDMRFKIKSFVWILLAALLYEIATFVVLFFIGSLCKAFRDCDTPFCDNVIRKMKNLAFSLIPMALLSGYSDSMSSGFLSDSSGFPLSVDLSVIIAILLIFGLAYIFQYGAKLQQESDETL